MNFNDEKSPIWIRVCPFYIGSDEANKRCFLHFYPSDLTFDWEHFYSFSVAMIDIEWCVGNASFPRKCPQKPCRPRMPFPAFEDNFKGHLRCLTDVARPQHIRNACWKHGREQQTSHRRPIVVSKKMEDQISSGLNRGPESPEKALNSVVFTTIWFSEPDCESLTSRDCNASKPAIYG
ncbi:hypothetical protein T07_15212 [Trichinella nelsoni]|uniref:Uncharacterized protein n=1 Tax=Trichinella nelsoni TaxID=6336 RepID=A0A0V0S5Q6_9BILA|nr:hypothetical protein T07_15212 [Trichinella nelsoni]